MAFQPFGYRFEIASTMLPAEAKAALRSGMKGWFETRDGPRGWIIGPFFCLWRSAFDRHGPMLLGRISHDNLGTRVRGRAGSDLNGVLAFSLFIPFAAFLVYVTISEASASTGHLIFLAGLFVIGGPLVYWLAHKDRRQAEPLVNFVRRSLGATLPVPKRRASSHPGPYLAMELTLNGQPLAGNATPEAIRNAVEAMSGDSDGFVILGPADEVYMQVAIPHGDFVLEKREGSEDAHFEARKEGDDPFTAEEVIEALVGYLAGVSNVPGVRWSGCTARRPGNSVRGRPLFQ